MVDPVNLTQYDLTTPQLEEYILFSLAVAGKNAQTTAHLLDTCLQRMHSELHLSDWQPFEALRHFHASALVERLKSAGLGCYQLRARGFLYLAEAGLNLRTCSLEQLEACPGIGLKTSRLFVLHTRRNAQVACLDVHILHFLRDLGYTVPTQTPSSRRHYMLLEEIFLEQARKRRQSPAKLDLAIWRQYSGNVVTTNRRTSQVRHVLVAPGLDAS